MQRGSLAVVAEQASNGRPSPCCIVAGEQSLLQWTRAVTGSMVEYLLFPLCSWNASERRREWIVHMMWWNSQLISIDRP
jgi:hypothetical protein